MSFIDGNKSIKEINIPGTHDSGTQYVSTNVKHYRCQSLSIKEQLEIGVRYLDIRSYIKGKMTIPQIKHAGALCLKTEENGSENCLTLSDVIKIAENFLLQHSSEAVFLQVKNEGGNDRQLVDYLSSYINNNDIHHLFWTNDRIPLLSEIRGKIVLIRRFTYNNNDLGINLSSWDTQCGMRSHLDTYVNVDNNAYVQDRYDIAGGEKYRLIKRAIEEANDCKKDSYGWWLINLTSCTIFNPFDVATAINQRLMEESLIKQGTKLGTFVMDFVNEELVKRIYSTNPEIV